MSASNKKKLRKQEAESQMTQRQQAASKEAKKQKTLTLTFIISMVLVVCITVGALLTNPVMNVVYRKTEAVQVGDYSVNAVELNYFYKDAVSQFYTNYKSYISYLLSTTAPLNEQVYDKESGKTWADYFVDQAHSNIKATYAVYDLAMEEGYTLSADYKTSLENTMMYMSMYASLYGYNSVDAYLVAMYGNGATEESYRAYYEKCLIAEAYYADYSAGLEYTPEQLTAYHNEHTGEFSSYTYAYYYLATNKFYAEGAGVKGEDGKTTYTDEEIKAAVEAAKEAADSLAAGEYEDVDAFNAAINALPIYKNEQKEEEKKDEATSKTTAEEGETEEGETEEGETEEEGEEKEEEKPNYKYTATEETDILYTKVRELFRDWIIGKVESEEEDAEPTFETRVEGDMTVIPYTTTDANGKETVNGYYVIRYQSANDNDFLLKNVRHILVSFEKSSNSSSSSSSSSSSTTEYTKEEKLAAKKKAEDLLKQWQEGEATEESFAALAKEKSTDTGSKANGGLYENVYPGQMVENFENWCFDETREEGDVEIVETNYGYHIMYFVGDSETTFVNYLLTETMRSEDTAAWYEALVEKMTLVAVTDKYVNKSSKIA